jgi:membrane protein
MDARNVARLLKQTLTAWNDDNAPRLGAALAYYAVFSIPPLVTLLIGMAGLVWGDAAAAGELLAVAGQVAGPRAAQAIEAVLASAARHDGGVLATVVGTLLLVFGATGVFAELQQALNIIWRVPPRTQPAWRVLSRQRFNAVILLLGSGLLLGVSVVATTGLAALGNAVTSALPGGALVWQVSSQGLSLAATTVMFAALFKYVPDVQLRWRDVLPGALLTAMLFSSGGLLLGIYLRMTTVVSAYGAAGSLTALLVWLFFSAQVFFLGAEFTHAYVTDTQPWKGVPDPAPPHERRRSNRRHMVHAAA